MLAFPGGTCSTTGKSALAETVCTTANLIEVGTGRDRAIWSFRARHAQAACDTVDLRAAGSIPEQVYK